MSLFDILKKDKKAKAPDVSGTVRDDAATESGDEVISFEYYFNGSIGGNSYSYKLKAKEKPAELSYRSMENDYGDLTSSANEALIKELSLLCAEHKIKKWNGFDKTNPMICDGEGFSLYVGFSSGKNVSAHGGNCFPKGYFEFKDAVDELFKPLIKAMCAEGKTKKIEKGVSGKLKYLSACFSHGGASGEDKYEIMITTSDLPYGNFSIDVTSKSEEYFPAGRTYFYGTLPGTSKLLELYDAIAKKHDIEKWIDWDEKAENYKECEWFEIHFEYEDGSINARGTKHPSNYSSFRDDVLRQMRETAIEAEPLIKK